MRRVARCLLNYRKKWLDKNKVDKVETMMIFLMVILFVFMIISATNCFYVGHAIWHSRLFSHLFVDGDGKFNWIGITSILAIISLVFNAWDRRRQFKADLVSKSRITWIENVRVATADLIYLCNQLWAAQLKGKKTIPESYQNEKILILKQVELLTLYFGPDQETSERLSFTALYQIQFYKDIYDRWNREDINRHYKKIEEEKNRNQEIIDNSLMSEITNKGKNRIIDSWLSEISELVIDSGYGVKNSKLSKYDDERLALYKLDRAYAELQSLSKVVSVYLKVEWNRAKTGN